MAVTLDVFGHPVYSTTDSFKNVVTSKYFYEIDFYIIDRDENAQYQINDNLSLMQIIYDYGKYVFPLMQVKLSLDYNMYRTIRDHNVEVKMNMYKILIHDDSSPENSISKDIEPYFENKLFTIIDKNKIILNDDELNKDMPSTEMEFTLFANEHLNMNKKLYNGNFLNVRLVDILAMDLSNNFTGDILIEKPNNMVKFNQLLIPPMNATKLPKYLQEKYSVYDDSMRVLFNYNEALIMNSTISSSTPVAENDYRYVILDLQTYGNNEEMPNECGYKTTNGGYYYIKTLESNIKISDKTRINQEIFGSNNIVFSKNEDLSTELNVWEQDEEKKLINKRQLYYDKYNSPYGDSLENGIKGVLKFNSLDIDTFKPNKLFYIKLNDKYYNFKVSFASFIFRKDGNTNLFNCNGVCRFSNN